MRQSDERSVDPAPPLAYLLTEPARGVERCARFAAAAPWLVARAPRGEPTGVLVLPGLLATDTSTVVLREFLRSLGHVAEGWALGRNVGPTAGVPDGLPERVDALARRTGGPVSLVGWSLGGIFARELARRHPERVRQVITLGSPFAVTDSRQSRAEGAYRRRTHLHAPGRAPTREQVAEPIPVPSTAVFSRRDGIVAWAACRAPETDLHQNVEVRCGHLGFGVDPATLWVVADRLASDPATRSAFSPPRGLRWLFPDPPAGGTRSGQTA